MDSAGLGLMNEQFLLTLAAEWGPWAIVALLLYRCIRRQDERENKMSEALQSSAAAMQELSAWLKARQ